MTQRKGEITTARLRREWPHHVALSADKVQGHKNCDLVHGFADTLPSVAPRTFSMFRRDRDYVVFCQWITPMARDLKIHPDMIAEWAWGRHELPPDHPIFAALAVLVAYHDEGVAKARKIMARHGV
jgi:hypothetical protein